MTSLKEKDLESSALQDQDAARPTLAHNNLKGPSLQDDPQTAPYPTFSGDIPWSQRSWLYEFTPFRGMYYDLKRRLPFYKDDWLDALHPENWYKITESTIRMYFINLMPALAYILDMYHRTHGAYGVNEVILASALAAIVFSVFSMQPLTFVGVTGLINLVNYTQYNIVVGYYGLSQMDYLRVQAWSLIWSAGFHFLAGIFNLCDYTRFITDMTSETFGFYVGIVYIQKGIELLLLEFEPLPLDNSTGWLSVTIAILFTVSVYLITSIGSTSYLPFKIRSFISSFAFTAGIIFWTGFSHFPKNSLERIPIERLPITKSFFPTMDRSWFIDFWNIEIRWVFVGAPLGFLITLLFYFDHNVSSVMAQARQFPVKKPAGFHWDFFLLGVTTLVSGLLGLPAPNGLVPQAPVHTESLSVYQQVNKPNSTDEESSPSSKNSTKRPRYQAQHIVNTRVVEQRLSHFAIGLLTIGTMTRPLLVVLGTMPRAVFAGVFILVGWGSIEGNGITRKTLAVFRDRRMGDPNDPLKVIRRKKIALYVGIQWLFFALTIAISQTIAAIGFPVIITLLIPFRFYLVPKWFSPVELSILDAPTAEADVVLASLGHESERVTGKGVRIAKDTGCAGTEWKRGKDDDDDDSGYDDGLLDEYVEREEKSEAEKHHDRKATGFGFGLRKRAGGKDSSQSERDIEPATTNVASSTSGTAISSSPNETSNKTSFLTAGNQDQMVSANSSTPAQSSSAYPPSSDKLYPSIKSDSPSQEPKSADSSAAPAVAAASALPLSGSILASKAVGEDKEEKRREKEGKKKAKEENERLEKEKKLREKEEKKKEKESKPGLLASLFRTPLTGNEENGSEKKEETNPTTEKPLPTPIPTATSTSYPPSSDRLYPTSTSIAKETSKSVPEVPSKEVETSTPTSSTKDAQSSTQKGGLFASLFKTPLIIEESKTKGSDLTKREGQDVKPEASTSTSKDLEISAPTPISKDSTPRSSWPVPIATSTTGRASTSTTSTRPPVPSKDTPVKETPTPDSKEGSNEAPLSPRSKSRLIRVENPRRGPGIAPDPIQWRE